MNVIVKVGDITRAPADLLAVNLFEGTKTPGGATGAVDKATRGQLSAYLRGGDFNGKLNETLLFRPARGIQAKRILVVGLGKKEEFRLECARQAAGTTAQAAEKLGLTKITSVVHGAGAGGASARDAAQAVVEGIRLGGYRFTAYKSQKKDDAKLLTQLVLVEHDAARAREIREGARLGKLVSDCVVFVRDLANRSGSDHPPALLAEAARNMAREVGLRCTILERKDLEHEKMGALLGVGRGSRNDPRLIVLEHRGTAGSGPTLCVVGKGITFDSGGISLKPPGKMDEMKFDMSGGAAAMGVARAAAMLKLPVNLISIIPSAENLPGGGAYKPGDVLVSASGITIEVLNTDAEGRLVLADGLHYATRYKPEAIIDLATLTGACVVALGTQASGLMTNHAELADRVKASGEATHERVWELPMFPEYHESIKSDVADIKNIGAPGEAGPIAGGVFLQNFVKNIPWVHLDIAGTAWTTKNHPYAPKGSTGVGVRLLTHLLSNWVPLQTKTVAKSPFGNGKDAAPTGRKAPRRPGRAT
jgi:leucyl aminopeptidase